jgi:putative phosphoribosyl transferase
METRRFRDRAEAGRLLAERLRGYAGRDDVVVLALPRGGVPVAYEVAKALGAPLHVFVVRKLGVPGHEELAMGAIASGGLLVLDEGLVRRLGIGREQLERAIASESRELERREAAYGHGRGPPDLEGKTVILVDDGLATGATMRGARRPQAPPGAARRRRPGCRGGDVQPVSRRRRRDRVRRDAASVSGRRPLVRRLLADDG